ncbi:MAG: ATP-binding protein, partial [Bacteroidota bacterium]
LCQFEVQLIFDQGLTLGEEENKRLQAENLNQKLRLRQDQSLISLFILGLLFLVLLISYLVHLGRIRNRQRDELQRLVGERTAQVEAANVALIGKNEELQASNSELERFAFIASHDLKTPLHNMIRFAGLLRKKLSPISDTDINTHLNFIEGEGKRMNTLIEDVLEYSKLNRQFEEENIRPILLGQLLNELSGSISGYVTERRAKIVYDYSLPEILWNYTAIFVLFKNLVENGIKYNQSAQPEVRIYGRESEEDYTLFVADNGIGIEEEFFDKIFEMFARLHNQKEYEGSGLGLASCKKIVDDFGGKIGLSSIPGEGTTFRIDIPRHLLTAQVRAV